MSTFKSNKIISKPNLQPVNSPTISEQSPATTKDQQAQIGSYPHSGINLTPSNLTDIESFDQNHEVSPKSRRTESSSVYEEAVDTTYQYLQQQLPQQPTNTSIISKIQAMKLSQCQLNFHSYQIILRLHCLLITELDNQTHLQLIHKEGIVNHQAKFTFFNQR